MFASLTIHLTMVPLWSSALRSGKGQPGVGPLHEAVIETRISQEHEGLLGSAAILEPFETPSGVAADLETAERLPDTMLSQLISSRVRRQLQSKVDPDQAAGDLREMASRLQSISSEQNIAEITNRIGAVMGLSSAQTAPRQTPLSGEQFDHSSAQLHDVTQSVDPTGNIQYLALMVDARGVRMEVPLDEAEGRELCRLFQLMRDFPFLEKVYRSVVIEMVDRLLEQPPPQPAAVGGTR